jgi:hypothetical protein
VRTVKKLLRIMMSRIRATTANGTRTIASMGSSEWLLQAGGIIAPWGTSKGGDGFVAAHPWHKYKNVPRMGRPGKAIPP